MDCGLGGWLKLFKTSRVIDLDSNCARERAQPITVQDGVYQKPVYG